MPLQLPFMPVKITDKNRLLPTLPTWHCTFILGHATRSFQKRRRNGICWQFLFYVVLQLTLKMRFMRRTGDPVSVRTGSLSGDAYELKLSGNENKSMQVLIVRAKI
jgi:hypothetical protein